MDLRRLLAPSDSVMSSLRGGAVAGLLSRGAGMGGAFAMSLAVLRSLPPNEAGLVLFAYTLLTMAATLGRFGADNLALREVSRDPAGAGQLIRYSFLLCVIMAPVSAALLVFAVLLHANTPEVANVAVAAALGVLPASLSIVAGAVLRGLGRVAAGTFAELGSPLILAAIGIAAAGLTHQITSARAVGIIALSYGVTALWAWILIGLRVHVGARSGLAGFGSYFRQYRASLTSFFVTSMGFFLFSWMPVLALGYFVLDRNDAQANVALFNAGARLAQFVAVIPTIQISYLSQRFAKLHHEGDFRQLNLLSQSATKIAIITAVPIALVLALAPRTVLGVFGGYGEAALTLQILALGALVVAFAGPVNGLMLTCGHEKAAGRYTLAILVVSAVALPILARWGSAGVAIGSAAVSLLYAVLCYVTLRRAGIHAAVPERPARHRSESTHS